MASEPVVVVDKKEQLARLAAQVKKCFLDLHQTLKRYAPNIRMGITVIVRRYKPQRSGGLNADLNGVTGEHRVPWNI